MGKDIYILAFCDICKSWNTMRLVGATTDETILYAMIAAKIKNGEMEYGNAGAKSFDTFSDDFNNGLVDFDKLEYGFVYNYDDLQITDPVSLEQLPEAAAAYEEITRAKAKAEIAKLELESQSLVYSVVEVRTDFGYKCFMLPGICDRDMLESSNQFQELMEDEVASEVNASVYSYCVGDGESQYPSEEQLKIIEDYQDELEDEYGIDSLQSDFISFYYEAEQEY